MKPIVGIEKLDKLATGHFESGISRSAPTAIRAALPPDPVTEGPYDLEASVGRPVVDDYDFAVGVRLPERAGNRASNVGGSVPARDHDGNARIGTHRL
jgi:hypothetical protein